MKAPSKEIEQFINNKLPILKAILIYGPDQSLITQRSQKITKKFTNLNNNMINKLTLSYHKINNDISYFTQELFNFSLDRTKKLLIIEDVCSNISKSFQQIISDYQGNNLIVLLSKELGPNTITRKFFENAFNSLSIACYSDQLITIKQLIQVTITRANLKITNKAIEIILKRTKGDRMVITNELEKLILYNNCNQLINKELVELVISDSSHISIEELVNSIFDLDRDNTILIFELLIKNKISLITIYRSLNRYLNRLYQVKFLINKGINQSTATNSLIPPVFYKQLTMFNKHIMNWSLDSLLSSMDLLIKAEISYKKNSSLNSNFPEQVILEMINYNLSTQ